MDVNYINPFLQGTLEVLKTMASINATPGKPYVKKSTTAAGDISGIIGITGDATGSLAISFSEHCICDIVNSMLGENHSSINAEIIDAVGELTNMISGAARNLMEKEGIKAFAAIPTVIHGKNHTINAIYNVPSIIIPFSTQSGPFFVDVCIRTTAIEERTTADYQVINKKTEIESFSNVLSVKQREVETKPQDKGTILRQRIKELLAFRIEIDKQLSENPFMPISRRKALKTKMMDIEARIRRLKLDISTREMLSKMDSDKSETEPPTNFQNHPVEQK